MKKSLESTDQNVMKESEFFFDKHFVNVEKLKQINSVKL